MGDNNAVRTVVALGASAAILVPATASLGSPGPASSAPQAAVFLDPKIHGNPGHNHATDHDHERVATQAERVLEKPVFKPKPTPKGYKNEEGPAVIHLKKVKIPADPKVKPRGSGQLAAAAAAAWTVPSAGTWVNGPSIERVVHV